jgi:hypothetical protein
VFVRPRSKLAGTIRGAAGPTSSTKP